MYKAFKEIEELFPGYFSEDLSEKYREAVDSWRKESADNEKTFRKALLTWNSIPLLNEMNQFNSFEALKKVNARIETPPKKRWFHLSSLIAAALLIPIIIYSLATTKENKILKDKFSNETLWQTVTSHFGTVTELILPDSSKVWLNSGTKLSFPTAFAPDKREVRLFGEAYFDVTKNPSRPFIINVNDLHLEVLGTQLNVSCFNQKASEVILVEGRVALLVNEDNELKNFGEIKPGERAIFNNERKSIRIDLVDVSKHTSWKQGIITLDGERLEEAIQELEIWYNADIEIIDKEINDYTYRATIAGESLEQVLDLLAISAPISYKIESATKTADGNISKRKIYLTKKK